MNSKLVSGPFFHSSMKASSVECMAYSGSVDRYSKVRCRVLQLQSCFALLTSELALVSLLSLRLMTSLSWFVLVPYSFHFLIKDLFCGVVSNDFLTQPYNSPQLCPWPLRPSLVLMVPQAQWCWSLSELFLLHFVRFTIQYYKEQWHELQNNNSE